MTVVLALLAQLLHIALMLVVAPTMAGVTAWLNARLTGTAGPPLLAPWRDLLRWSRKNPMLADSGSIVSRLAPALALGATLAVAAVVPSFSLQMALSPLADVLVIVSMLALARTAATLAALDSGAPRSGLTAQQGSAWATMAESALMLSVVALALMAGGFNLNLIIAQQREGLLLPAAASSVALAALMGLLFADVDTEDNTYSGIDLAIVRMTGWLRRLIWLDLIGALFLPVGMAVADDGLAGWLIGLAAWGVKLSLFVASLSAIQTLLGRIPRRSLPDVIGVAALLALLAIIMVLASAGTT